MKKNILSKINICSGLALALAMTVGLSSVYAAEPEVKKGKMKGMSHTMTMVMNHIKTQAEAEALKPGDSMSMTCAMCKFVVIHKVGADKAHVKMMTIGEKSTCLSCDGKVKVVGTGKGKGKHEEVKHVCSNCGDDVMFVCATKAGSGDMKDMKKMKKGK